MKTRSLIAQLIGISLNLTIISAQNEKIEQTILEAKQMMFQATNESNRDLFLQAKSMIKPLVPHERFPSIAHYYLGYIDYRMGVVIERLDEERANAYLDSAIEHLEAALEKDEHFAEANALLASCYGIKISFSPIKGIIYGPKSSRLIEKAKELAPANPRVALLDAIGIYNTPAIFGGGKEKGLQAMKRSAELFDKWKDTDPLQPSWGNEEVYAWIGIAHAKRKEVIQARNAFERALEINPNFGWVKYKLLPALIKQTNPKE